jgi:hypothetical protein
MESATSIKTVSEFVGPETCHGHRDHIAIWEGDDVSLFGSIDPGHVKAQAVTLIDGGDVKSLGVEIGELIQREDFQTLLCNVTFMVLHRSHSHCLGHRGRLFSHYKRARSAHSHILHWSMCL